MSESNTTLFDNDTDVSLHAGNPNLSDLETARERRAAREQTLADRALEVTPHSHIGRAGAALRIARAYEITQAANRIDIAA